MTTPTIEILTADLEAARATYRAALTARVDAFGAAVRARARSRLPGGAGVHAAAE